MLWTTTEYDLIGRVTAITTPDNARVTTSYQGNQTTVTDQALKSRRSLTDALGRLTTVIEDPNGLNYQTVYQYDALDNLRSVNQGSQTRTFAYDSLSRLTQAFNPESGTVSYLYDSNGNLTSKTDARSIVTNYQYDALNRLTQRSYSDSTPSVTYAYDSAAVPFSKGRLASVISSASSQYFDEYDPLGRVKSSRQTTDSQTYSFSYGYDLAGNLTSETYPSGRLITTSYDSAGRISGLSGQNPGEGMKNYVSTISYEAHGAMKAMALGNGLWEHADFNSRLQPTEIGLGTSNSDSSKLRLAYGYGSTNNNGNVLSQNISFDATAINQSYTYDALSRLKTAGETSAWNQTFDYDRYGNRAVQTGSHIPNPMFTPQSLSDFSASNNRIIAAGYEYDAAGNMTRDVSGRIFGYDAENHQINFNNLVAYSYDGDGKRVKKTESANTTVFVYDAFGQLTAEYESAGEATEGTQYLTSDHLGSTRAVTDASGTVKQRIDYLPFGEELGTGIGVRTAAMGYGVSDELRQKFTGYERDNESGLDFAQARYFGSFFGRFTSPDPFGGKILDPQSLNRYTYTLNNPFRYTDPTGSYVEPERREDYGDSEDSSNDNLGLSKLKEEFNRYLGMVYNALAGPEFQNSGTAALLQQKIPGTNARVGDAVVYDLQIRKEVTDVLILFLETADPTGIYSVHFTAMGYQLGLRDETDLFFSGLGAAGEFFGAMGTVRTVKKGLQYNLRRLRNGDTIYVDTVEEARELIDHLNLRPGGTQMPTMSDPRGTYRGDLVNTAVELYDKRIHPKGSNED